MQTCPQNVVVILGVYGLPKLQGTKLAQKRGRNQTGKKKIQTSKKKEVNRLKS